MTRRDAVSPVRLTCSLTIHIRVGLELVGVEGEYRIRVGNYRVACEVDSAERQIIVLYIRHRREAYR